MKMKMALWKEFRQTWKWVEAATALLVLAQGTVIDSVNAPGWTKTLPIPVIGSIVGFPILAIILAFVQFLPEQERDRWASTLHWPISRGALFLRKTGAGLIIYLGATGLCIAVNALLFAIPGIIAAPFVPGLYLAVLVDIACGAMYYFAAVLIALPRGPSRLIRSLVVPIVFVVHVQAFQAFSWWSAMEMALGLGAALGWVGYGILTGNGAPRLEPKWSRAALIALVSVGILLIGTFALLVTRVEPFQTQYGRADSTWGTTACFDTESPGCPDQDKYLLQGYRRSEQYLDVIPGSDPRLKDRERVPMAWYYRRKDRVFVGYDPTTRLCGGYVGVTGYSAERAGVTPFPEGTKSMIPREPVGTFWWNANTVYKVNFSPPSVTVFFDDPAGQIACIQGAKNVEAEALNPDSYTTTPALAIALPHQLNLVDLQGKIRAIIPYPPETAGRNSIRISGLSQWNASLVFSAVKVRPQDWPGNCYMVTVPPLGSTIGPADRSYPHEIPARYDSQEDLQYPAAALIPSVAVFAMAVHDLVLWNLNLPGDPNGELFNSPLYGAPTFAGISGFCALLAWALARAWQIPRERLWMWVAFVFAMNVAGFLTFLMLATRSRLVRCPSCRCRRAIDTDRCPHCSAAWPEIPRTGTEIFETEESVLPAAEKATAAV